MQMGLVAKAHKVQYLAHL